MKYHNEEAEQSADRYLLILTGILIAAGLAVLFSTSEYNGRVRFYDSAYYFKKQFFATALGLAVFYAVSLTDYHKWIQYAPVCYLLSLILSTLVLFVGQEINGSRRWLSLGPLSFQPSEFSKLAVILLITWRIEHTKKKIKSGSLILQIAGLLLPIVALVGSNNLSTAVIILGIGVFLIFMASPGYRQFVSVASAGIFLLIVFLAAESYRLERLKIWRNPEQYDKGFQTVQGLYAIGSGGIFGVGFGKGIQKLGFVPEAQNDMIFSILCEETGFFGAMVLILLFIGLLWRLCVIALHCRDLSGALLCTGILGHLAIQVILNIAVVTNTIPNTGITLPFVSYGGTSIVFLMSELGLALSVSRQRTEYNRKRKNLQEQKN